MHFRSTAVPQDGVRVHDSTVELDALFTGGKIGFNYICFWFQQKDLWI